MARVHPRPASWHAPAVVLAACLLALAVRAPLIGDPIAGVDEQFYLLVGERMWHGALPYVDIWDRKPVGLFLVYAALRALPGDGVLAYQLATSLTLALTGAIAAAIARRGAGRAGALAAGAATIGFASFLGQGLGEAPIVYDLLTTLAAWAVLRVRDDPRGGRAAMLGAAAMLACGVAITIKTVAAFEGAAFGLLLLAAHRSGGEAPRRLAWRALGYAGLGLAPTALAALVYAALGHWSAFWFANVVSILLRTGGADAMSAVQLVATLLVLSPLLLPALLALRDAGRPDDRRLLAAWAAATGLGFAVLGYFQFHYAVPMVAPLAILAARGLRGRGGAVALAASLAGAGWLAAMPSPRARDRADLAALLAALPPEVRGQCLLIREGPAVAYHFAHACLASRYAFPGHFSAAAEAGATGTPRATMTGEALARRPAAIVDVAAPGDAARLHAAGYRREQRVSIRLYGATRTTLSVWVRRDLVRQMSNLGPYADAEHEGY